MTRISLEEELDEEEDELDAELVPLDDDGDDDLSEPGETWNWPSAVSFVALVFAIAFVWHDCLIHR